jgi:predicted RNase H-like HicB family nuclease
MKYQVVLEHDPETGHHTATVAGLPGLFVDAKSEEEALSLAREAIAFYLDEVRALASAPRKSIPPLPSKIVTVDL